MGGVGGGGRCGLDPLVGCLFCPATERKEILTGTKCISVKAARRRSRAVGMEGRHLLAPAGERSSLSLHSPSEADDSQPAGPLACKRPPSPTLQHAASEDNLSSSTGEAPSQAVGHGGDGAGPWMRGQKKSPSKKREELLEAKRRKRRSRSFEVTGQGVRQKTGDGVSAPLSLWMGAWGLLHHPPCLYPPGWHKGHTGLAFRADPCSRYHTALTLAVLQPTQLSRPKTHLLGPRPMESTSDHRVPVCGHPAPGIRHLGKVMLPLAKVRLPPSQSTGQ